MAAKPRLILVCPALSQFIKNDIALLQKHYRVRLNAYTWYKKKKAPLYLVRQFFWLLRWLPVSQKVVVEFGGYWSLLPAVMGRLFRVPVYIVLHGTDCASLRSVNYGSLRKSLLRWFCGKSYRFATALLPVSQSLVYTQNTYHTADGPQGFTHFFPGTRTLWQVVPNGLDLEFWQQEANQPKETHTFIAVFSPAQFRLKGGALILEAAEKLPHCRFLIAGTPAPPNGSPTPANVVFLGKLTSAQLKTHYQRARYHLQLSLFEGFGLALCEAMLNQCVPIVSSVNTLPEIIGDSGYVLTNPKQEALVTLIKQALSQNNQQELGKKAQVLIQEKYPLRKREAQLLQAINL